MALFCILGYLLHSKLLKLGIKIRGQEWKFWEFCMILEYFSLEKGPFIRPLGRLGKILSFYFRIITSFLKMNVMPCSCRKSLSQIVDCCIWCLFFIVKLSLLYTDVFIDFWHYLQLYLYCTTCIYFAHRVIINGAVMIVIVW